MRALEQLLEAVEYSRDIDVPWTEQFSDITEARDILNKAMKQITDEYEIARLSIAMGEEPPEILEEVEEAKRKCFLKLKRTLAENR